MDEKDDPYDKNKTPYRWLIFVLFMLSLLFSSSTSLVFSPISSIIHVTFGIPSVWVNMCANIYNFSQIWVTFVGMYSY